MIITIASKGKRISYVYNKALYTNWLGLGSKNIDPYTTLGIQLCIDGLVTLTGQVKKKWRFDLSDSVTSTGMSLSVSEGQKRWLGLSVSVAFVCHVILVVGWQ